MTEDGTHEDVQRNADAQHQLRDLVNGLSDADLDHPLGEGWTVASALGHLAFWDGRQRAALQSLIETGELAVESDAESHVTNEALLPVLLALDPRTAANLALESAEAIDTAVARLPADLRDLVLSGDGEHMVRRWRHRREHIDQISAALGR